jgi:nucleoside-diphosphate-sugar epimerase
MGLSAAPGAESAIVRAARERVLVLGASGFIGERVVAALAATDWASPVAASRSGRLPAGAAAESLRVDTRDTRGLQAVLGGVAAVVNCVAGDTDSVASGAQVLFAACARMPMQPRVVHLSTMQVYGSTRGRADEQSPLRGDWDAYGAAKVAAEQASLGAQSVVILRPGIVYGPGSPIWTQMVGRWLIARRLGDLGPAGDGVCNLVHVDDVVKAVLCALRLPGIAGEAFNLSLPQAPSWNAYFRSFAGALGAPVTRISRQRLLMEQLVLAPPLKLAQIGARTLHLAWQPPAPLRPWFLRLCSQALRLDVGKAERVLGMRWKPLAEGLHESADWLRSTDAPRQALGRA